jgi:hypothetical protein
MDNKTNSDLLKGKFIFSLQVISGYLQQYSNAVKNNIANTNNTGVYERFEHIYNQLSTDIEKLSSEYDFIDNKDTIRLILKNTTMSDSQKVNLIRSIYDSKATDKNE